MNVNVWGNVYMFFGGLLYNVILLLFLFGVNGVVICFLNIGLIVYMLVGVGFDVIFNGIMLNMFVFNLGDIVILVLLGVWVMFGGLMLFFVLGVMSGFGWKM